MSIFRVIRSVQWNPVPRHLRQLGPAGLSVAQLVEHVTVDICDHRVAGSIPAAESFVTHQLDEHSKLVSGWN